VQGPGSVFCCGGSGGGGGGVGGICDGGGVGHQRWRGINDNDDDGGGGACGGGTQNLPPLQQQRTNNKGEGFGYGGRDAIEPTTMTTVARPPPTNVRLKSILLSELASCGDSGGWGGVSSTTGWLDSDIASQVFEGAGGNKWDRSTYDFIDGIPAPRKQAEQKYDVYLSYMHSTLIPKMKKKLRLGSMTMMEILRIQFMQWEKSLLLESTYQPKWTMLSTLKSLGTMIFSLIYLITRRYFQVFSMLVWVKSVHMLQRRWIVRVYLVKLVFSPMHAEQKSWFVFMSALSKRNISSIVFIAICHMPKSCIHQKIQTQWLGWGRWAGC
jgi:hypothetical protein